MAEAAEGVAGTELRSAARQLQEAVGHLAGEEARADGVNGHVAGAELDGEVAAEVNDGSLGGRVAVGTVLADGADAETSNAGGDEDARRVSGGGTLLEHRGESLDGVEDGAHVQVHDLGKGVIRVLVKGGAPGRAGVGEQDVDVISVLLDLRQKALDTLERRRVGGDRDGLGARLHVGKSVELLDGFVACLGLARRDEDLGSAGLEEAGSEIKELAEQCYAII